MAWSDLISREAMERRASGARRLRARRSAEAKMLRARIASMLDALDWRRGSILQVARDLGIHHSTAYAHARAIQESRLAAHQPDPAKQ